MNTTNVRGEALAVGPLQDDDRADWQRLATAYKLFYRTTLAPQDYDLAWRRLRAGDVVHALGARHGGRLVGITHYLFHVTVWSRESCYLQDLYVDESVRGQGVGRALIEGVAAAARQRGATKLHWLTANDNARARRLYDQVARHVGFIRYDYPLD